MFILLVIVCVFEFGGLVVGFVWLTVSIRVLV